MLLSASSVVVVFVAAAVDTVVGIVGRCCLRRCCRRHSCTHRRSSLFSSLSWCLMSSSSFSSSPLSLPMSSPALTASLRSHFGVEFETCCGRVCWLTLTMAKSAELDRHWVTTPDGKNLDHSSYIHRIRALQKVKPPKMAKHRKRIHELWTAVSCKWRAKESSNTVKPSKCARQQKHVRPLHGLKISSWYQLWPELPEQNEDNEVEVEAEDDDSSDV